MIDNLGAIHKRNNAINYSKSDNGGLIRKASPAAGRERLLGQFFLEKQDR